MSSVEKTGREGRVPGPGRTGGGLPGGRRGEGGAAGTAAKEEVAAGTAAEEEGRGNESHDGGRPLLRPRRPTRRRAGRWPRRRRKRWRRRTGGDGPRTGGGRRRCCYGYHYLQLRGDRPREWRLLLPGAAAEVILGELQWRSKKTLEPWL